MSSAHLISAFTLFSIVAIISFQNCSAEHIQGSFSSSSDYNALLLQQEAMKVLDAKCASCHTPASLEAAPENILDAQYLADNGYLVAGEPHKSRIYLDVVDEIMPPPESGIMISEDDLAKLRDWIISLTKSPDGTIIGGGDSGGDGSGGNTGTAGTFTQVRQILQARCVDCHSQGGRLPLDTYEQVVGFNRVVPGDPANSELNKQVALNLMPQGAPLTSAQKETISSWIAAGALNN